ncbi:hypothetical protein [Corynebacterium sp. H113]|uniref:hypothetical protein n=1 Tax=Corynebacterium sp. H113 TaxID=3133419 RepID=UPI00309FEEFA
MKKVLAVVAFSSLALAGCSEDNSANQQFQTESPSVAKTPITSKTPPKPSASSNTTNTTTPTQTVEASPENEEPYVVECIVGTPGSSRMSDGTIQNTDFCANQQGTQEHPDAEGAAGPSPDEIPIANGGTCPAAVCGYGTDEYGNPNPSSGELQTMHGCEAGYIDDPALCGAVQEKAEQYGW